MNPPVPFAYSDFVAAFPEFANTSTYPQAQISFWENVAYEQLDARRFGVSITLAAMLFVAHNVTLSAQNAAQVAVNGGAGLAGQTTGPVSSKSVGGVSKSMDVGAVTYAGAGPYNMTSYGIRLMELMKRFSLGGAFVRGPSADPSKIPLYGIGGFGGW